MLDFKKALEDGKKVDQVMELINLTDDISELYDIVKNMDEDIAKKVLRKYIYKIKSIETR